MIAVECFDSVVIYCFWHYIRVLNIAQLIQALTFFDQYYSCVYDDYGNWDCGTIHCHFLQRNLLFFEDEKIWLGGYSSSLLWPRVKSCTRDSYWPQSVMIQLSVLFGHNLCTWTYLNICFSVHNSFKVARVDSITESEHSVRQHVADVSERK